MLYSDQIKGEHWFSGKGAGQNTCNGLRLEGKNMFKPRGFYTSNGYVGFLPDGSRIIFATHNEYAKPFALKRITDSFNE